MRAVVINRPGPAAVLELREIGVPEPGPEEIRVAVRAAGVNRADLLQRRGLYPAPPGVSADIPGLEFAGTVETAGPGASLWRPGDRVMGLLAGGGYAERIVVHERLCLRIPPALGWEEAAAVPEAFLTAFDALLTRDRLGAGETLLIEAASSGVGTAALQLARVAGARVIGLSRDAAKRRRLEQLGVERALDPGAADLEEAIRLAAGGAIDVVLALVGAPALPLHLRLLREGGRIVVVGLLGGARAEIDLGLLMTRRATLVGTVLRSRGREEKIALVQRFSRRGLPLLAAGRIAPIVHDVLPLAEAAEAHSRMERNEPFGKLVLRT